ncbi:MAG: hypothetical protein R3B41_01340 [Candidatus Doudnabacteria bacterium]
MEEKIKKIIDLIETSDLDRTIKDILIRDLQTDGLTDFLREQIKAYCLEGIKRIDERMKMAEDALQELHSEETPAE